MLQRASIDTLGQRAILTLSSFFGLGYLPVAPGTWGTCGALGVWYVMAPLSWPVFAAVTALLTLVAIAVSSRAEAIYGGHDVQHIVIDEVVGLLATVIGVPFAWPQVLSAFVLFRLLDAFKPPPICYIDRHMPGGLGVVLDDTLAGLIGCALLHGLRMILGGWW
jgi:phosphatidylglycerophosphatase A